MAFWKSETATPVMASPTSYQTADYPDNQQQKISIQNNYGEKLVGVLHETGSRDIVVLCHGFRSSKECKSLVTVAVALEKEGISTYRFDFSGNGESEGSFQYGNYHKEVEDLRAVLVFFCGEKRVISGILGHSKGKVVYRVTEESLMDRLTTDMQPACLSIRKDCRVLAIHGSLDEIVPAKEAFEFAKMIVNHELRVIDGADHEYTSHQAELASIVLEFLRTGLQQNKDSPTNRVPSNQRRDEYIKSRF